MIDTTHTCSFTGHRPKDLYGYVESAWLPLVETIEKLVTELASKGVTTFITGGAQGVDQAAFWAVRRAQKANPEIRNILYLPFPGFDRKWKKSGLFSRDELALACQVADEVHYIDDDEEYSPVKLLNRNSAMLRDSNYVIAVWDAARKGDYHTSKGGTADALRKAEAAGKHGIVIDPHTLTTTTYWEALPC